MEEERRLCYVAITRAERFLYVSHAMRRRVYGEEMASEPSQFLNEMPLDLMEDLSRGASWLSFARSSSARLESRHTARVLRGETANAPRETFRRARPTTASIPSPSSSASAATSSSAAADTAARHRRPRQTTRGTTRQTSASSSSSSGGGGFVPGTHVRHPKYGRGLVLRREGAGDAAKLTVSFPGFGQKKLIEKYAGLEKA